MNKIKFLFAFLLFSIVTEAGNTLQNVYSRQPQNLGGSWRYIVDPFDNGYQDYLLNKLENGFFKNQKPVSKSDLVEYNFDTAPLIKVPGDWNTQDDKLFFYEGSIWYKKDFTFTSKPGKRVFLYFGAVNYQADVYLNGDELGTHKGGFTPFNFEVTNKLKNGNNFLILRVNNVRHLESLPTPIFDWWNYGGITRDVLLVEVPQISVDDYLVQLPKGTYDKIEGYVQLSEPKKGVTVSLNIPELKIKKDLVTGEDGKVSFSMNVKPKLWSPESPKLYDVIIRNGEEVINDKIGFRQIETHGRKILLNGKPTFLRGISIHEEAPFRQGRVCSKEEDVVLLTWAKELGCNFVRLAHYPHNEFMVRAAEEMGLMVWSEIPVYWNIQWLNPETFNNASNMLKDVMDRDKNRCGIVIWSIANETPRSDARDNFLGRLIKQVRDKDNTRLVSMAMEVINAKDNVSEINDNMCQYVDIVSFNSYIGWYVGKPDDCLTRKWVIPNKPFFVSEFGAGALQGNHGDKTERWTEEYQEEVYKKTLDMFDRVEGFSGTSPWILMDFRSPNRQLLNSIQDFFNRKGVISERGIRKKAFYVLQNFYKNKKEKDQLGQ